MRVAATFDEYLRNLPRTITFVENEDEPAKSDASLDVDAATDFNLRLPASLWKRAVSTPSLPANLRARFAQAGMVRTIVLGESPTWFAQELATLKPAYASDLASIDKLTGDDQKFAAIFWILHHLELSPYVTAGLLRRTPDGRIDDFRENWWCGLASADPQALSFLTRADQKETADELAKLKSAGPAPTFLTSEVVAWANAHPADQRDTEALALAVKSSRFGCSGGEKGNAVERAFHLLHERYPKTRWAEMTPYWF